MLKQTLSNICTVVFSSYRVSKSQSAKENVQTRGLYYPDDMFVTNWVPTKFTANELCSTDQPGVTNDMVPSCDPEIK